MTKLRIYVPFLTTLLMMAMSLPLRGADSSVKIELDSVQLIMGNVTRLSVNIVTDANAPARMVEIPAVVTEGVEKHSETDADTADLGNNRIEIRKEVVLQSFDSGMYIIPPVKIVTPDGDTIASNQVTLKVYPCNTDTLTNIHPYAPVSTVERKLADYMPDWVIDYGWWILLAIAAVAALGFIWYKWLRQGKKPKAVKVEPPYNVAMREFKILDSEKLCEKGQEKEFYTRLTDILRTYLERRFGIYAMEMTSNQILEAINSNEETRPSQSQIERILRMADFVKFAKARPLPEDNVSSLNDAIRFVEDTKPVPKPEPAPTASTDKKTR